MDIRDATLADSAAIAWIYNEGLEDRVATLETTLRTAEERKTWLEARGTRHPVLVACDKDKVVGWASLNPFNPRPAYDFVADFSIYVLRERRGTGIGGILLNAREERARNLSYHKLVLAAFPWNTSGMRLYEKAGFRTVGTYREHGWLDERWVDVVVMEKILDS